MNARFLWRAYRARFQSQATELALVRKHVRRGDLTCDIGANKGSYLYWLSRWSDRVVAFEPQPELAGYLRQIKSRLKLSNITLEQQAVSATSGELDLYVPNPGSPEASLRPLEGAARVRVPVVALDDYFAAAERVAFLKVDVEGAELDVFKGAERTLTQDRPVLLFEYEQRHLNTGTVFDCFTYLEQRGYRGSFIHGREIRPIKDFDPAIHQRQEGPRFWRAPDYCNNFLFEPA